MIKNIISFGDTGLVSLDGAYKGETSLSAVNLGDGILSGVTTMRETFANCTSLTELDLSGWSLESVTDMEGFLSGSTLTTESYGSILTYLYNEHVAGRLNDSVVFHGGDSMYYEAVSGYRSYLTDTAQWIITDGGLFFIPFTGITDFSATGNIYSFVPEGYFNIRDVFFNDTGTKMIMWIDWTNDLYEYTLSTPYDPSTASPLLSQFRGRDYGLNDVYSFYFKDDGYTFYMMAQNFAVLYKFSMSTQWSTATASVSLVGSYDFSILDPTFWVYSGVTFSSDGNKVFISDWTASNDAYLSEYNLSAPWDISSPSFVQKKTVAALPSGRALTNIKFSSDGTRLYGVEGNGDRIYQYTVSTPYTLNDLAEEESKQFTEVLYTNGYYINNDEGILVIPDNTNRDVELFQA